MLAFTERALKWKRDSVYTACVQICKNSPWYTRKQVCDCILDLVSDMFC